MAYRGEQKIGGKIYVYEATAQWNPEKKRSEQKRIYIGKKDEETGELIPNKNYYKIYGGKPKEEKASTSLTVMKSVDFGNVYLLDQIAQTTGLKTALENVFPKSFQEILACAWYCITENDAFYLCEAWSETTAVAEDLKLSSQNLSKLLRTLDENSRMTFYKQWASLRAEKEYLAFDISSISSYSELIEFAEYGYNRDKEKLPQINLAMLFGEESRLPVFCRVYPGSIKDVTTLTGMVEFINELKIKRMHYVMDKGFYSGDGIGTLLEKRIKFAVGVPFTTSLAKDAVAACIDEIRNPINALEVNGQLFYAQTTLTKINDRRAYIHVYFDEGRHIAERTVFMQKLLKMEAGLKSGKISPKNERVQKYFKTRNSKNGLHIHRNEEAIQKETELNGFFVILTNDSKDAQYTLDVYRTKDVVEKSFDNLKNDLDMRRLNVHSDAAMEGRIFIGFISLILASHIRNIMKEKDLYQSFTFSSLLAELKKVKCVQLSNKRKMLTELNAKQKRIYKAFGIEVPNSTSI